MAEATPESRGIELPAEQKAAQKADSADLDSTMATNQTSSGSEGAEPAGSDGAEPAGSEGAEPEGSFSFV